MPDPKKESRGQEWTVTQHRGPMGQSCSQLARVTRQHLAVETGTYTDNGVSRCLVGGGGN